MPSTPLAFCGSSLEMIEKHMEVYICISQYRFRSKGEIRMRYSWWVDSRLGGEFSGNPFCFINSWWQYVKLVEAKRDLQTFTVPLVLSRTKEAIRSLVLSALRKRLHSLLTDTKRSLLCSELSCWYVCAWVLCLLISRQNFVDFEIHSSNTFGSWSGFQKLWEERSKHFNYHFVCYKSRYWAL